MADRKKGKSKNRQDEESDKPSKEECAVAKHLRFGLEQKEAKLVGMTVKYFIACEAVDKLMESKWATNKNKQDNIFHNRQSCVNYLDRLLVKGMFHRAARVDKKKKEERTKRKDADEDESQDDRKLRRRKKDKEKKKEEEKQSEKEDTEKEDKKEKKDEKKDSDKKKKEKKVKLRMHDEQIFVDGDEVYVWIYDPVNVKTFIVGLLMVLGTIGLCMFPLWPPVVRQGVYYLSLAGAVFVGCILLLAVVRFILFCLVWLVTGGRHHFWFLPNLTEDVGFFDSFRPLYTHSYKPKKEEKPAKAKESDTEDNEKEKEKEKEKKSPSKGGKKDKKEKEKASDKEDSEISDNGYELVDKSEVTDTN